MVRSKAPIRYITQSGVIGVWSGDSVAGGGGNGGGTGAGVGDGVVGITGRGTGTGDMTAGGTVVGAGGVGAELVAKAPTALQALWVSELMALTFQ